MTGICERGGLNKVPLTSQGEMWSLRAASYDLSARLDPQLVEVMQLSSARLTREELGRPQRRVERQSKGRSLKRRSHAAVCRIQRSEAGLQGRWASGSRVGSSTNRGWRRAALRTPQPGTARRTSLLQASCRRAGASRVPRVACAALPTSTKANKDLRGESHSARWPPSRDRKSVV